MTRPIKKLLVVVGLFLGVALLGTGSAAGARLARVAGPQSLQLVDEAGQVQAAWTVAATIQDVLQVGDTLYVACGPAGVLIYDLATPDPAAPPAPSLRGRIAEGRNAVKLAHNGRSLLVAVADFSALTFSLDDPHKPLPEALLPPAGGSLAALTPSLSPPSPVAVAAPRAAPPQQLLSQPDGPRAPTARWARVTKVRGGWIAVETTVPAQLGDRFIVRSQRRVRISDPTAPGRLYAPSNQAMGMFVVTRVVDEVASGPLPRGTVAQVGDLAEPTAAPFAAPKVAPRLWYGMGRFYGTVQPLIEVSRSSFSGNSNSGLGLLSEFTFEYYFRFPLKLGVQLAPLGLVTGGTTGLSTELRALISFASSYFELGLSPGAELHLLGVPRFTIGYMLRLGSLDGLNLILHNSYVLVTGAYTSTQLSFGSIIGEINIPLASRFSLYLNGGGSSYWAYGTLGLKYYLRGGGGPGTLILNSGAGGAWVSDRCVTSSYSTNTQYCNYNSTEGVGPTVALGLDARF